MVTPEINRFIQIDAHARQAKEASGAAFLGPDCSVYPGWYFDLITTIELHRNLEQSARMGAM